MKKRLFFMLTLAAALLLALGMTTALAATADDGHAHWAWCDAPTVCAECGEAYSGPDVRHDFDWEVYAIDEEYHWHPCNRCDAKILREKHEAVCSNPTVCTGCKQTVNIPAKDLNHSWTGEAGEYYWPTKKLDEQYHAMFCPSCNQMIGEKGEHRVYCDSSHTCIYCLQPCPEAPVQHESDYTLSSDENYHWYTCKRCGEELDKTEHLFNADNVCGLCGYERKVEPTEAPTATPVGPHEHWAWCDEPTVCAECGEAYDGTDIRHEFDRSTYASDEKYHWYACKRCETQLARQAHQAVCIAPNVCTACGHVCEEAIEDLNHSWSSDIWNWKKIDETYHVEFCPTCNQILYEEEHTVYCDGSHTCAYCLQPCPETPVVHDIRWSTLEWDENNHWYACTRCEEKVDIEEHVAACSAPGKCMICGAEYSGKNVQHKRLDVQQDEKYHWYDCPDCDAKILMGAHIYGADNVCTVCGDERKEEATETPTVKPTEKPTEAPTEAPTEEPTATPTVKPTEVPTEAPTETPTTAPTDKPTEQPTEAPTEAPTTAPTDAPTAAPTEVPTEVPTTAPTAEPTQAPHTHVFRTFVSRGDGTHRSDCEGCGTFTVEKCQLQSRTVNGIACQVCSICGYTTVPAVAGMALPEAPMADVNAVTEAGEAAAILLFDVTASLPEDSTFALCLRVAPPDGMALPGSVRITIPCTVDTTGLHLIFIPDGGLPVNVPFGVGGGMITFNATAPGIFALVPVQE